MAGFERINARLEEQKPEVSRVARRSSQGCAPVFVSVTVALTTAAPEGSKIEPVIEL